MKFEQIKSVMVTRIGKYKFCIDKIRNESDDVKEVIKWINATESKEACCICDGCFFSTAKENKSLRQHEYCSNHIKIMDQIKRIQENNERQL